MCDKFSIRTLASGGRVNGLTTVFLPLCTVFPSVGYGVRRTFWMVYIENKLKYCCSAKLLLKAPQSVDTLERQQVEIPTTFT